MRRIIFKLNIYFHDLSRMSGNEISETNGGSKFSILMNSIFSFSTVRQARIHDIKIGIIFRILQIGIIGYVIGYRVFFNT